ncbi:AraC family transcriptional regulator, partial [Bradyrhizobium sp. UFLA06-06]
MHTKAVLAQAVVGQNAFPPARSTVKLSATDLNNLMQDLDIDVIALTELLVPRSHRVEMGMIDAPGIHYNLSGVGHISINGGPKIQLSPHSVSYTH